MVHDVNSTRGRPQASSPDPARAPAATPATPIAPQADDSCRDLYLDENAVPHLLCRDDPRLKKPVAPAPPPPASVRSEGSGVWARMNRWIDQAWAFLQPDEVDLALLAAGGPAALMEPTPFGEIGLLGAVAVGHVVRRSTNIRIADDLLRVLQREVGKSDAKKFFHAAEKGFAEHAHGTAGVIVLREKVGDFTHELKITGSSHRLLGKIEDNGDLVFTHFEKGGLHYHGGRHHGGH